MASRDPERPNVLFVLADDLATWGVGCYGNPEIRTPNLDRLADRGVRLDNLFCTSPVCSPSRASILTGSLPSQHGIQDAIQAGNCGPGAIRYLDGQDTYTARLAESGYRCALLGKWHLGDSDTAQCGFDYWFAHRGGNMYRRAPMTRGEESVEIDGYLTDVLTADALAFLDGEGSSDAPFYLSVHYTAPHAPWLNVHPPDDVAAYDNCAFESCPQEPEHPWSRNFRSRLGEPTRVSRAVDAAWAAPRLSLQGYFAAVAAMDRGIGEVLDRIDRLGLTRSTVVIVTSDNGFNAGHHGIWGKGNGTFPQNMYDTSVKVPGIVSQPGRVLEGHFAALLISGYDLRPTILELCGVADRPGSGRPGASFASSLTGAGADRAHRPHVVVYDEYGPVRMIRTAEWKYVHRYPYGPNELYHLEEDPGETNDLSETTENRDVVGRLHGQMEQWFDKWADPEVDARMQANYGLGQINVVPSGDAPTAAFRRYTDEPTTRCDRDPR